jgi:hypothetical protein
LRIDAAVIATRWIAESDGAISHDEASRLARAPHFERLDPEVVRILRRMSGMERLRIAHQAWELARDRLTAFFTATHPDWSPDRVRQEVGARLARTPS